MFLLRGFCLFLLTFFSLAFHRVPSYANSNLVEIYESSQNSIKKRILNCKQQNSSILPNSYGSGSQIFYISKGNIFWYSPINCSSLKEGEINKDWKYCGAGGCNSNRFWRIEKDQLCKYQQIELTKVDRACYNPWVGNPESIGINL